MADQDVNAELNEIDTDAELILEEQTDDVSLWMTPPRVYSDLELFHLVTSNLPRGVDALETVLEGDFVILVPLERQGELQSTILCIQKDTEEVAIVQLEQNQFEDLRSALEFGK